MSDNTLSIYPTCIEQISVQSYINEAVFNVLLSNLSPVPVAASQEMPMHSTENVSFPQGKQGNAIPLCSGSFLEGRYFLVHIWLPEGFEAGAYANLLHSAMAFSGIKETNVSGLICYVTTIKSPHHSVLYCLFLSFT